MEMEISVHFYLPNFDVFYPPTDSPCPCWWWRSSPVEIFFSGTDQRKIFQLGRLKIIVGGGALRQ